MYGLSVHQNSKWQVMLKESPSIQCLNGERTEEEKESYAALQTTHLALKGNQQLTIGFRYNKTGKCCCGNCQQWKPKQSVLDTQWHLYSGCLLADSLSYSPGTGGLVSSLKVCHETILQLSCPHPIINKTQKEQVRQELILYTRKTSEWIM